MRYAECDNVKRATADSFAVDWSIAIDSQATNDPTYSFYLFGIENILIMSLNTKTRSH